MSTNASRAQAAISLPKGGGAIKGIGESFQANLFNGTGNHSLPLALSPGRGGFGPQLALEYSSVHGNGIFGLGWQLPLARITRKTEKGLPGYDDNDVFVLSGAEDLVRCLKQVSDPDSGQLSWVPADPLQRDGHAVYLYRPRTEGLFARIERWVHVTTGQTHWRTISRDNITSLFGTNLESRLSDPGAEHRVYEWLLRETFDALGNHSLYEYAADSPQMYADGAVSGSLPESFERRRVACQRYIRRIYYGNLPNALLDAQQRPLTYPDGSAVGHLREGRRYAFEVVFDYGDWASPTTLPHPQPPAAGECERLGLDVPVRVDRFSSFRAGFDVRALRRCQRVLMFHHFAELGAPTLVRSTDFSYTTDPDTLVSLLVAASVTGHRRDAQGNYHAASVPPVTFSYSQFRPHEQHYQSLTALGGSMPPLALNDPNMALVDLFGDGLPDLLHTGDDGFRYWRNLGRGSFDRPRLLAHMPAGLRLDQPGVGFGDMAGNGIADLLVHAGPLPGFFETTPEGAWQRFVPFESQPNFSPQGARLRMIDLTGDGRADALLTQDTQFLWFECLGESGFAPPRAVERVRDADRFPDVQFDDPSDRTRLADMTGDGLQDIVRVYDGRIDYWPNLGRGRFGPRISMANPPQLDRDFDARRLFLVDLNGTGCADLAYVGSRHVSFWFNRSGNAWSAPQHIRGTPATHDAGSLAFADIFGTGTAALVWSRDRVDAADGHYKALDFCGGVKPYVLVGMDNSMGMTTRVQYAASTQHFLRDRERGQPWITALPFPVQVVDKVEVIDHVGMSKRVCTYQYHHGHYDGREREFCGFGRVDQFDSEHFADFAGPGLHGSDLRFEHDAESHTPVVETRSWFHTGLYVAPGQGIDHRQLAQRFRDEYGRFDDQAMPLDDPAVEAGATAAQAWRALRGSQLRSELYAHDGSALARYPYQVSEARHRVLLLQPAVGQQRAVFFSHAMETLECHYERNPADPRIEHQLNLQIDAYGNPLRSLRIAYGRRQQDPGLPTQADRDHQAQSLLTYTEQRYTHPIDDPLAFPDSHRVPAPCASSGYELTGFAPAAAGVSRFSHAEWLVDDFACIDNAQALAYQATPDPSVPQKRLVDEMSTRYRKDDLSTLLPLGSLEPLALPGEGLQRAYTDGLHTQLYGARVDAQMLAESGYVRSDDDLGWWVPSGRVFHSPEPDDTPAEELAYAREHFFAACRSVDAFGNTAFTQTDPYVLQIVETRDALGNRTRAEHDYHVLQAARITDANGNRSQVAFDTLGLVIGTAVMGKAEQQLGDSLADFSADLTPAQIDEFWSDPGARAATLLGSATTRIVCDLWRFQREALPVTTAMLCRETHISDGLPSSQLKVQTSLNYHDGLGREIQKKVAAEPGPLVDGDPVVEERWVGSGWTVFNNKGKPVRRFEPFFDDNPAFRFDHRVGVATTLLYDPLQRVVATLHPNHTWEKVAFDAWTQTRWDANDTVLIDHPEDDPDVGGLFRPLTRERFLPTWYAQRHDGALGAAEQAAAQQAVLHAATPSTVHVDAAGRSFLSIARNRFDGPGGPVDEELGSRVVIDIQGNQRELTDARGRVAMRYAFDMLGNRVHQSSMDAGERWLLSDVTGLPVFAWDSRGHRLRTRYDALRRPLEVWLQEADGPQWMIARTVFGEGVPDAESNNLRGRVHQSFDQAGVVSHAAYDFKGNLLLSQRQLCSDYKTTIDWSSAPPLDAQVFVNRTRYDALNRPVSVEAPDQSITRPRFNHAGLLQGLSVQLRGAAAPTPFVTAIDHDAKGRRSSIAYGNGVRGICAYDPLTLRPTASQTLRGTDRLQDLRYTHDAVGNLTQIEDRAQQTMYFKNQVVAASAEYRYDALYRLRTAHGREHIGQASRPETRWDDAGRSSLPHPQDGQAMRRYVQTYDYDPAGNLLQLAHRAVGGDWTRHYHYQEASLIEAGQHNNRLSGVAVGGQPDAPHAHDAHGNMTRMPHLAAMHWDFADQLRRVDLGGGGTAYYVHDAAGQRLRKVVEKNNGHLIEERITLGGFDVFRRRNAAGVLLLERETLHIMDDRQRIALVDTRTHGDEPDVPVQQLRYQVGNHLGSATLELDGAGHIVSYEEYHPFGSTAYQAGRSATEVSQKRFRYSGLERDEETGLQHHGARYYAPWLGRWTAADPIGPGADGSNLYAYVANNPIGSVDPTGFESESAQTATAPSAVETTEHSEARHTRLMEVTRLLGIGGAPPKSTITDVLAVHGDGKALAPFGYTPPSFWENREEFRGRVRQAILGYHLHWQASHGGNQATIGPVSATQISSEQQQAFFKAWLQGLPSVAGSLGGAFGAGAASWFTDDPQKIAAAAGLGDALQGAALAVSAAKGNRGGYAPGVENEPVSAMTQRVRANAAAMLQARSDANRAAALLAQKQTNAAIRNSIKDVNPSGCTTNCAAVGAAVESTRAGHAASALPIKGLFPYDAGITSPPVAMTLKDLVPAMRSLGPGARAVVWGERAGGAPGHVFNLENSGGTVLFLEGQIGNGRVPAKVCKQEGFVGFRLYVTH